MSVVLEPLDTDLSADGTSAPLDDSVTAVNCEHAAVSHPSPPAIASVPDAPMKRPRGRPKGSVNKPKPPVKQPSPPKSKPKKQKRPPSTSSDSSESDEPPRQSKRTVVKHLMEDDMETQVLRFLNARKQNQEQQRRSLWQNLAASGLR